VKRHHGLAVVNQQPEGSDAEWHAQRNGRWAGVGQDGTEHLGRIAEAWSRQVLAEERDRVQLESARKPPNGGGMIRAIMPGSDGEIGRIVLVMAVLRSVALHDG
jgi:hypothetical protein